MVVYIAGRMVAALVVDLLVTAVDGLSVFRLGIMVDEWKQSLNVS